MFSLCASVTQAQLLYQHFELGTLVKAQIYRHCDSLILAEQEGDKWFYSSFILSE